MSYDKQNLTFRAIVLLNLLNSLRLAFYLFSPTRLINSLKHEHSCKILYLLNELGKRDKCEACSQRASLINSIIQEHECKILFII